jgi:hypothetical protein
MANFSGPGVKKDGFRTFAIFVATIIGQTVWITIPVSAYSFRRIEDNQQTYF